MQITFSLVTASSFSSVVSCILILRLTVGQRLACYGPVDLRSAGHSTLELNPYNRTPPIPTTPQNPMQVLCHGSMFPLAFPEHRASMIQVAVTFVQAQRVGML